MVLIFGGAYQGKKSYAQKVYGVMDDDFFVCDKNDISLDLSKKVIYGFDKYILALVKHDVDASEAIENCVSYLSDKIIICDDISSSVVPVDPITRKWREAVGRGLNFLSMNSDVVVRLLCGIGQRVK